MKMTLLQQLISSCYFFNTKNLLLGKKVILLISIELFNIFLLQIYFRSLDFRFIKDQQSFCQKSAKLH